MTTEQIADRIYEFLDEQRGISRDEVGDDGALFTSGLLDSLELLRFIAFIERDFGLRVSPLDVSIERFDTVRRLAAFISELQSRQAASGG